MTVTTNLLQDVRYLDLDGDGVPDAVLIRETLTADAPDGMHETEVIETLETGIDIDGVPRHIEVHADAG
jgi:hypothetical protein